MADAPKKTNDPRTCLIVGEGSQTAWTNPSTPFGGQKVPDPTFPPPPGKNPVPADTVRKAHHLYTLGPPLAQGGLGQILLARDEQLERTVALKEMLPGPAQHTQHRERFYQEAALTSLVEHPGVVPVYDMGVSPEGKPFYTMKLIKGRTFADALDDYFDHPSRTKFRELLTRYVAVCQTMAFAHSRGVIHRDLKPANIMLGEFGETLVVDWGLAKHLPGSTPQTIPETPPSQTHALTGEQVSSTSPTQALTSARNQPALTAEGDLLGTLGYMSPEQAQGELDKLGPATDIYSLGVILYEMVTGQRPFRGNAAEILQMLLTETPPRPSRVRSGVPRPLEAVCLKALAFLPGDRYPTAMALAADVERWLNDEPVSVLAEPLTARLGRWARRHRTAVLAGLALLLMALLGSVVGTILLSQEQGRTHAALQQSLRNEQEAAEYFRLAQTAVDELCTKIGETRLRNEPGMEAVRRELLDAARKYYQQLTRLQPQAPGLRLELAKAQRRLANITAEIESPTAAVPLVREALGTLERLQQERPADAEILAELGIVYHNLGKYLGELGQTQEEMQAYQKALQLHEQLSRLRPLSPIEQYETSGTHYNVAMKLVNQQRWTDAEDSYRRALALIDAALQEWPKRPVLMHRRAMVLNGLGILYKQTGRLALAKQTYGEAAQVELTLVSASPKEFDYKYHLATLLGNLALVAWEEGRFEVALRSFGQALGLYEELAQDFPRNQSVQEVLAQAMANLGEMHLEHGDVSLARQYLDRALSLRLRRAALVPTATQHRWQGAQIRQAQVRLFLREGKVAEARTLLDAVQKDMAQWTKTAPQEPAIQMGLHHTEIRLLQAELSLAEGRSNTILQDLQTVHPATPEQLWRAARLCVVAGEKEPQQAELFRSHAVRFLLHACAQKPVVANLLRQEFRNDPVWAVLRDHPELQKLLRTDSP
jgi:serine/threonine-protein kinase